MSEGGREGGREGEGRERGGDEVAELYYAYQNNDVHMCDN